MWRLASCKDHALHHEVGQGRRPSKCKCKAKCKAKQELTCMTKQLPQELTFMTKALPQELSHAFENGFNGTLMTSCWVSSPISVIHKLLKDTSNCHILLS